MAFRFRKRFRQDSRSSDPDPTIALFLAIFLLPLVICGAAVGTTAPREMTACIALVDDGNRLACFDDMARKPAVADGIGNDPPQVEPAADAKVMRFICMHPDKVTTYFVDVDLTNGTASYSTRVRNVSGRWGPFAVSVGRERISWDELSDDNGSNAARWSRSHWFIDRPSGHMRIEAEGRDGKMEIQRNILCNRR